MPSVPKIRRLEPERVKARVLTSAERKADQKFYDSAAWQRVRRIVLMRDNGLCQQCKRTGRIMVGSQIDHIKPRKKHPELALSTANCEVLCRPCHNAKRRDE